MAKRRGPLKHDPVDEAAAQWSAHGFDGGTKLRASLSLLRAGAIVRERNTEILREFDLSLAHHEVLTLLWFTKTGELPLGKIGERLMVHPTSVSNAVDALSDHGLVERTEHPDDRRTRLARITRKGRNVARRAAAALLAAQFGLGELDEADADALFRILCNVRASANDFENGHGCAPAATPPTAARRRTRTAAR